MNKGVSQRISVSLPATLIRCGGNQAGGTAVNDAAGWRGKTMVLTARPRASLMAVTAGKAMFAVVGAVAMMQAGKTIVAENGIEDPAPRLGQDLLGAVEAQYGVVPAPMAPIAIDTTDIARLARAAAGADLLLDAQSYGQGFRYHPPTYGELLADQAARLKTILDTQREACFRKS